MAAMLLSLFGEEEQSVLSDSDKEILMGEPTIQDIQALSVKYPEYMGVWQVIAKVAKGIAEGAAGTIQKAVSGKRNRAAAAKAQKREIAAAKAMQVKVLAQQKTAMLLGFGLAAVVVGVGAIYLLKRR